MIETENNTINELRGRQPFRVPEGYFEGFTNDFMSRLPKKTAAETKVISLYDRVKPWLYMAAAFAGIIVVLNIFIKSPPVSNDLNSSAALSSINVDWVEDVDDDEFLELLVDMYADASVNNYDDYWNDF